MYEEGSKFGRWQVVKELPVRHKGGKVYLCRCECGTERSVPKTYLQAGNSRSCGCLQRELASEKQTRHGMSGTPEYNAWCTMWYRCSSPKCKAYKNYGGRGVTVCKRWHKFENFLADLGYKPFAGAHLDRKNNEKGYTPANAHWTTVKSNMRNRRNTLRVVYRGASVPLAEAAERARLAYQTVLRRYNQGERDHELFRPARQGRKL